jgi:dTDP-glucose 4,6-dehydratase
MIFVTGGAGFIGSNFLKHWLATRDEPILNIDCLTYAGNLESVEELTQRKEYSFSQVNICDGVALDELFLKLAPRGVIHFAAESHVDRSILGPMQFIQTNVVGTGTLLESTRRYWQKLTSLQQQEFRFLNVSTDEVYGTLSPSDPPFEETTSYKPNSPYAASKAAADHLVRAYFHTYGLPTMTSNCSNNYGPYQFPEKLIPVLICNAADGKPLPIYGDGSNVRDWLYVEDHCRALDAIFARGVPGDTYAVGGWNELSNLEVVRTVTRALEQLRPSSGAPYESQITFVKDRPGHDRRYAINATKVERELGWKPLEDFESGILKTVAWYLNNQSWLDNVRSGAYQQWIKRNYADR